MGKIVDGVKTVNSAVRTVLLTLLVGTFGLGGYSVYSEYTKRERELREKAEEIAAANEKLVMLRDELETKDAEINRLGLDLKQKEQQISKLKTSMQLLKTDQRLARLDVVSVERDENGTVTGSQLKFVELSPQGKPITQAKTINLPGDIVYVDNWIVKFDDKYVENGDVARGTSLCLFRRIFSEQQSPNDGVSLDEVGMRPQAYASGGVTSDFEKQLWGEFWEIANNPARAAELGIRAANGEAVSIKVREGMAYTIELRSSGGLSIQPISESSSGDDLL